MRGSWFKSRLFWSVSDCVFCCSAPQQGEASDDFLKSCSADGVSCTTENSAVAEEEGESELVTLFNQSVSYTELFCVCFLFCCVNAKVDQSRF